MRKPRLAPRRPAGRRSEASSREEGARVDGGESSRRNEGVARAVEAKPVPAKAGRLPGSRAGGAHRRRCLRRDQPRQVRLLHHRSAEPLRFGPIGIGAEPSEVYTVHYRTLAAVVSDTPIEVLDSTRENVLAHERVNETVMREHTVIPMSFGTVFKTRDDIVELCGRPTSASATCSTRCRTSSSSASRSCGTATS